MGDLRTSGIMEVNVRTFHLLWTFENHECITLMALLDGIGGLCLAVHDNADLSGVSEEVGKAG